MVVRGSFVFLVVAASVASAQPRSDAPALVGATEIVKITPPAGFVDDAIAFDGQRVAYVVADAADKAELHVMTLAPRAEAVADLAPVTLHPVALHLVGSRVLVVSAGEDGRQTAALVEVGGKRSGAIVYKLGPATHISVIARDGARRIAVHRATPVEGGTRHEVELYALETGRRVAAGPAFEVDASGANKKLDFRVNHWADGMTRAYGLKGGEWDRKEDQRTPDVEAAYDLVTGKIIDRHPIEDLFEQRKRYQILADAGGLLDFLKMTWDNSAIQLWHAGRAKPLELDQPITNYDPKSLQGAVASDGTAWFALEVDPVNPDAVARKKADPQYLDVFHAGADGRAVRKARVLSTGVHHRAGFAGDKFWLLERSPSFDRGGRSLAVYAAE